MVVPTSCFFVYLLVFCSFFFWSRARLFNIPLQSRMMCSAGHVVGTKQMRNVYNKICDNLNGEGHLRGVLMNEISIK